MTHLKNLYYKPVAGETFPITSMSEVGGEEESLYMLLENLSWFLNTCYGLNGRYAIILLDNDQYFDVKIINGNTLNPASQNPRLGTPQTYASIRKFMNDLDMFIEKLPDGLFEFTDEWETDTKEQSVTLQFSSPYPLLFALGLMAAHKGINTHMYPLVPQGLPESALRKRLAAANKLDLMAEFGLSAGDASQKRFPYHFLDILGRFEDSAGENQPIPFFEDDHLSYDKDAI